jgi:hypothetical protein
MIKINIMIESSQQSSVSPFRDSRDKTEQPASPDDPGMLAVRNPLNVLSDQLFHNRSVFELFSLE